MGYCANYNLVKNIDTSAFHVLKQRLEGDHDADVIFVNEHLHVYENYLTVDNFDAVVMGDALHTVVMREPRESVHSYKRVLEKLKTFPLREVEVSTESFHQLRDILAEKKQELIVIDSTKLLKNPEKVLTDYCIRCGLHFTTDMLSWEPAVAGSEIDGAWFDTLGSSTGFEAFNPDKAILALESLDRRYEDIIARNMSVYKSFTTIAISNI